MASTATTLREIEDLFKVTHLDHLDRSAEVPTINKVAFQGDVAIVAVADAKPATTPIPQHVGYPVVRGENGGNTHGLYGPGFYDPNAEAGAMDLVLGTLTVPAGAQVLLSHPEHGGLLIDPGTYEMRRQREQADEIRLVQD